MSPNCPFQPGAPGGTLCLPCLRACVCLFFLYPLQTFALWMKRCAKTAKTDSYIKSNDHVRKPPGLVEQELNA